MRVKYSQLFKTQAVEKALNRPDGTVIKTIAESLILVTQHWNAGSFKHDINPLYQRQVQHLMQPLHRNDPVTGVKENASI